MANHATPAPDAQPPVPHPLKVAYDRDDRTLIAKFRTPLDGRLATRLAATVIEHPEHVVTMEGSFLTLRTPDVTA